MMKMPGALLSENDGVLSGEGRRCVDGKKEKHADFRRLIFTPVCVHAATI